MARRTRCASGRASANVSTESDSRAVTNRTSRSRWRPRGTKASRASWSRKARSKNISVAPRSRGAQESHRQQRSRARERPDARQTGTSAWAAGWVTVMVLVEANCNLDSWRERLRPDNPQLLEYWSGPYAGPLLCRATCMKAQRRGVKGKWRLRLYVYGRVVCVRWQLFRPSEASCQQPWFQNRSHPSGSRGPEALGRGHRPSRRRTGPSVRRRRRLGGW